MTRNKFKKALADYLDISTVHGLKYLSDGRPRRTEKIFWTVALIAVTVGFFLMISETTEKFISENINIRLSRREHSIEEIPFPAITICPPLNLPDSLETKIISNEDNFINYYFHTLSMLEMIYDQDILSLWNVTETRDPNVKNHFEELKATQDFWFFENADVWWDSRSNVYFNGILSKWGYCLNFNLMPAEQLLRLEKVSDDFYYNITWYHEKIKKQLKFNYNLDYNENYPWKVEKSRELLRMEFERGERFPYKAVNPFEQLKGIRIIVHDTNELPTNPSQVFHLMTRKDVKAIVEPQVILADDDLRSISYDKRGCFFPGEKILKYFQVYTKNNCEQELLSLTLVEECGCSLYYLIRAREDKVCGVTDINCARKVETEVKSKRFYGKCLDTCETLKYQIKFVSTEDEYAWKIAFVFKRNFFSPLVKHRAYSFSEFMASVGGLLGLIAGISLMSFIEAAYHMLSPLTKRLLRKVHPEVQTRTTQQSESNQSLFLHRCSQYLLKYMQSSSIHGFNYMSSRKLSRFEKLFWIICVIVSGFFCSRLVVEIIKHTELNPTRIGIDNKVWTEKDIPFPAITFCPEIDQEKYYHTRECHLRKKCKDDEIVYLESLFVTGVRIHCSYWRDSSYKGQYCLRVRSHEKARDEVMKIFETFTEYDWITDQSFCLNRQRAVKLSPIFTSNGLCFTLEPNEGILKQDVVSEDFFSNKSITAECKTSENELNENYLTIDLTSNRFRRSMIFEMIILHANNELPSSETVFVELLKKKTFLVSPKIATTDESLRVVSPLRRNCYFPDEKPLRFFHKYSRENCMAECRSNVTLKICNCIPFYFVRDNKTTLCMHSDYSCFISIEESSFETCGCLSDCNSIEYEYKFITDRTHELKSYDLNYDVSGHDRENDTTVLTAKVLVQFENNEFVAYKRYPSHGIVEMVSNIGGLMGLFLGISVLSIFEFLYFFSMRLVSSLLSKKSINLTEL